MKKIAALLVFIITMFCMSCEMQTYDRSIVYYEKPINPKLISELKQEGIQYKIKDENTLLYPSKDEDIVLNLFKKLEAENIPLPQIHFKEEDHTKIFLKLLLDNKIPHEVIDKCCPAKKVIEYSPENIDEIEKTLKALYEILKESNISHEG